MTITTVFTNNRSQAIRLPADLRLPDDVKKVEVRARGADRIISPVGHSWDQFFLNGPQVSEDFLPERASQTQPERESDVEVPARHEHRELRAQASPFGSVGSVQCQRRSHGDFGVPFVRALPRC